LGLVWALLVTPHPPPLLLGIFAGGTNCSRIERPCLGQKEPSYGSPIPIDLLPYADIVPAHPPRSPCGTQGRDYPYLPGDEAEPTEGRDPDQVTQHVSDRACRLGPRAHSRYRFQTQ
jgi:hypothetical protein